MTQDFIADASVAIGWVHPAQATRQTAAMLDAVADGATLEVPALWPLEVANALLVVRVGCRPPAASVRRRVPKAGTASQVGVGL